MVTLCREVQKVMPLSVPHRVHQTPAVQEVPVLAVTLAVLAVRARHLQQYLKLSRAEQRVMVVQQGREDREVMAVGRVMAD